MKSIEVYRSIVEEKIHALSLSNAPQKLYKPIEYIMKLEGKRIRPSLMLAVADMYGLPETDIIEPAIGIEIFHNFTLVHDDIMDKATLRRGKETLHHAFGLNAGILSGDAMQILSYQKICSVHHTVVQDVLKVFNQTAVEVCEGQQMDMDFEEEYTVSEFEYLKMIELKTAVLLACSLKIPGILAFASESDLHHLYEFGRYIGIAFQIQDDLLDSFGSVAQVGKRIGGDICNNKKTLLLLKAMTTPNKYDKEILENWLQTSEYNEQKIQDVKKVFEDSFAKKYTEDKMMKYYIKSIEHLEQLSVAKEKKTILYDFASLIINRTY
jgi:geranylgeranyl diphosphate synthase, type II